MQKKWLIREAPDPIEVSRLKEELGLDEVIAYMLVQRGIKTLNNVRSFFYADTDDLHDPFLMKNMQKAVDRVNRALKEKEKILVYGDYDVDGTTAVSMMYNFLLPHHPSVDYYIPNRYKEGYGVSKEGIEFAKENGISLIITLDCGIKAIEKTNLANSYGIDVIICDHHTPGEKLPDAIVLDPKQKDCNYPYKGLSGCGVGFKLLQALTKVNEWEKEDLFSYLDLLAVSIGADIVPVVGENRIMVKEGMERLNGGNTRESLQIMLNLAKKEKPLTLTDVVFTIAPRINAAGRMDDAKKIVKLFSCKNTEEIRSLAKEIHQLNAERRLLDQGITEEALEKIENDADFSEKSTTVVYDEDWHKGVIGIVASRLIETHYRPTIVLAQAEDGKQWTGSARSIKGVNIYNVLEQCRPHLEKFGGHDFAAGLSLKKENLIPFMQCFDQEVKKIIGNETLIPEQLVERELPFDELFQVNESVYEVPRLMRVLRNFEPFGPQNMKPQFMAKNVFATDIKLLKEKHLKFKVMQPTFKKPIDAIYFNAPEAEEIIRKGPFDLVFTLDENEFRGRTTPQLMVKDIRPHTMPLG